MLAGHDPDRSIDAVFINSPLKDYDHTPRYNDFTLPVLGLGYIATYAKKQGLNVAVLDVEAHGIGIRKTIDIINASSPRWIGLNLLAPTYIYAVKILQGISSDIKVMLGGHQAKAMPLEIINDLRIPRIDALVIGEAETRSTALIEDVNVREHLPHIWWRDKDGQAKVSSPLLEPQESEKWLAPNINELPFVDRVFLAQDPFETSSGDIEANLVGSRGCPYDCSFCGAAISANPDITIRVRTPSNIIEEMFSVAQKYNANTFRFVDDLFLASHPFMKKCLSEFVANGIGNKFKWDATGRINVLATIPDTTLDLIKESGCREVALGIESGSDRLLNYIDKRISSDTIIKAVTRLTNRGIHVKGYFILGFPTETEEELTKTINLIHKLWDISDQNAGNFRCSVFEFRPYPGTPEWNRLISTKKYTVDQLLSYDHIDITRQGSETTLLERDEFNFSVNIQFGESSLTTIRRHLGEIMAEQKKRLVG